MNKLRYTGQTEGHLPLGDGQVLDVTPGQFVTPESAAHEKALMKSGHFEVATTKVPARPPAKVTKPKAASRPQRTAAPEVVTSATTPPDPAQPAAAQEPE